MQTHNRTKESSLAESSSTKSSLIKSNSAKSATKIQKSTLSQKITSQKTTSPKKSTPKSTTKSPPPTISKKILNIVGRTNAKYGLIKEGDKILLGLSGGKDSTLLATILAYMQKHAPFKFEFKAITIDYGRGGEYECIAEYCEANEIPYELIRTDIYKILEEHKREGTIYCSFCSRMRRGSLYTQALQGGFNKIALGHHLDDAAESFLMNLTYNGALRSMPPIYKAQNGLYVIRPMIFVRERQIRDFISSNQIYIAPDCNCPINWLPEDKRPKARASTKELLSTLESANPLLFKSLQNAFKNLHTNSFCDENYLDKRD